MSFKDVLYKLDVLHNLVVTTESIKNILFSQRSSLKRPFHSFSMALSFIGKRRLAVNGMLFTNISLTTTHEYSHLQSHPFHYKYNRPCAGCSS